MDDFRFIKLVFLFFTYVLVSNQMVLDPVTATSSPADVTTMMTSPTDESFQCPLIEITQVSQKIPIHNITRSVSCKNGKNMDGCCVERFYCDFNTSHIDLTVYGPPGFRMPCQMKEVCCPQKYILPMPLSNTTKNENDDSSDFSDDDSDDSSDD